MFNIFFVAFGFIVLAVLLALYITRQKTPGEAPLVPPEDDFNKDPKDQRALTLEDLQRLAEHLCKENKLTVKDRLKNDEFETYWIAESTNEFFFGNYVLGFLVTGPGHLFVTLSDLLEFKDFIKSTGGAKGFFFTTGYFTRDVHQPLEGPKVTLYNRLKVLEELKRF